MFCRGNSFISNYSNTSGLSSNAKSKANKGNGKPNLKTSATELDLLRKHRAPASNALQINTSQTSPDLLVGGMRSPSGSKPGSPNQGMGTSRSQKSLTSQPHNAFSAAAKQLLNNRNVGQNCKYINPVAKVRRSSTQAQESDDYKRLFMPDPAVNLNDPHRRLFALSASVGSDNQVWVGMQNYKAMTHSVSLNRNFKAKVVPASAKVEVNGEEEEE